MTSPMEISATTRLEAETCQSQRQYASQAAVDQFNNELLRRLWQLPGAEFAGLTTFLPTSSPNNTAFVAEGYVPPKGANIKPCRDSGEHPR